ncbi:MAG: MarR family transcriptional regulator [Pseudomonadota bacterium]|nr:MarR family transcriptional regulator [Pseudomonadota bacterium]
MGDMRAAANIDGQEQPEAGRLSVQHTEIASLIAQLRIAVIAGVNEEFLGCEDIASLEVTAAQFAILRNVLKGSAQSACELCKSMDYDRGAMSRMIDRLEAKQLVRRIPLAHTRRSVALEVTDAGKAAFPKMEACLDRVVARLLKGITRAQVREMETMLKRMLANA